MADILIRDYFLRQKYADALPTYVNNRCDKSIISLINVFVDPIGCEWTLIIIIPMMYASVI